MSLLRSGNVNSNKPPVRCASMSITSPSNHRSMVVSTQSKTAEVKAAYSAAGNGAAREREEESAVMVGKLVR